MGIIVVVCSSCAVRSGSCVAGAGTFDRRSRVCCRPCCFLVVLMLALRVCACGLRCPLWVVGVAAVGVEISCRSFRLRRTDAEGGAANPACLVEALPGSRDGSGSVGSKMLKSNSVGNYGVKHVSCGWWSPKLEACPRLCDGWWSPKLEASHPGIPKV